MYTRRALLGECVVDQVRGKHPSRVEHEQLEQLVLGAGQLHHALADPRRVREQQVRVAQRVALGSGDVPAHDRPQPRLQLAYVVGLHEIVVGPDLESLNAVLDRVAGGQHQDRRAVALAPQPPAHLEAVYHREPEVQDDRVGHDSLGLQEAQLAVLRQVDVPAGEQERPPDRRPNRIAVFDHQRPHRTATLTGSRQRNVGSA
jgi:hypothetical protein